MPIWKQIFGQKGHICMLLCCKNYTCKNCNYFTCKKNHYERHLLTLKHKNAQMETNGNDFEVYL